MDLKYFNIIFTHFLLFQAGRVPWNLSHLVGNFQSPSTTAAAVTPSDYATNQSVSASGGIVSGASGALPHPLPHYSSHPYASSPQGSAASYHQPELGSWGGQGGGGAGSSTLGMHGQSSPITGLTSVALSAIAGSGSASHTVTSEVGGPYGPTKMDPESITSMYYPHQVPY